MHTKEQFEAFMSQLKETNATLDFYCDFNKINSNVEAIAIKLNQLNYLIGQEDLDGAIRRLWNENPKVFSIIDILIAVRKKEKKKAILEDGSVKLISRFFDDVEGVIKYIHGTGLDVVLQNKQVKNLVDYVFSSLSEINAWIDWVRTESVIHPEIDLSSLDRFLTLSTCAYSYEDARTVLIGRLTPIE